MGLYALIKKDQPMLKDAVYIGTSVIEAVGITYAAKHIIRRDRPFVKYPDKIHAYGAPDADSPSFPSGHTAAAFPWQLRFLSLIPNGMSSLLLPYGPVEWGLHE